MVYVDSPEMQEVGEKLIGDHYPLLKDVSIGYLFRSDVMLSQGKMILGRAVRVDDKNFVYGGRDVLIEVSDPTWSELDAGMREVLIDHQLAHIGVKLEKGVPLYEESGRLKVFIRSHDVEEFQSILDRYPDIHKKLRAKVKDWEDAAAATKKG